MSVTTILDIAQAYADRYSGCRKVSVGCAIVDGDRIVSLGANRSIPDLCKRRGCLRVEKYGEDSKSHRLPSDCRAIHSEVDAIIKAAQNLKGFSAYVTRYPCEACARALITAGIGRVYYGGSASISKETEQMLEDSGVLVMKVDSWKTDNTDR